MSRRKTRDTIWLCPTDEGVVVADTTSDCPRREEHTPCPRSYLAWHHWAMKMMATHSQRRHAACGLFKIWVPKQRRTA